MRHPNCKCSNCGVEIYRRPFELSKGPVFCNKTCANARNKKPEKLCGICGTTVLQVRHAKYCSKSCANEAIRRLPRKPRSKKLRGWRRRLIVDRGGVCNRCPMNFVPVLEVHHKIERCNGGTDEPDNLEVLCPTCHAIHHYTERMRKRGRVA